MLKLVASDAPAMAKELGYDTEERFLREGLQLDPELVTRVVEWLDREKPQEAVTLDHVKKELVGHGGDRRSEEALKARQDQPSDRSMKYGENTAYLKARLERDCPEVAAALDRGEIKNARTAAIEAGIITPFPSLRLKDPAPTAQKLLAKKGKEWCLQLLDELSALVLED
jgi:hypothetical protein